MKTSVIILILSINAFAKLPLCETYVEHKVIMSGKRCPAKNNVVTAWPASFELECGKPNIFCLGETLRCYADIRENHIEEKGTRCSLPDEVVVGVDIQKNFVECARIVITCVNDN